MSLHAHLREEKFKMISAWLDSGQTQRAYCTEQGIPYHSFHYWYKKYRDGQTVDQAIGQSFVKLKVSEVEPSAFAELHFLHGQRLVFTQPLGVDFVKSLLF